VSVVQAAPTAPVDVGVSRHARGVPLQVSVPVQASQITPPVPQFESVSPSTQMFPEQQPFGQFAALHPVVDWQSPLMQAVPLGHALHTAPAEPQKLLV